MTLIVYAIDGLTGGSGSNTVGAATYVGAAPVVSFPTLAGLESDIDASGWEHSWFKIRFADAGPRIVDVSLSYDASGTPLPCYFAIFTYDGSSYDSFESGFSGDSVDFEDGTDYYVSVGREFGDGDGTSRMVLRVSDIGAPSDWFQPDDITYTLSAADNLVSHDTNPLFGSSVTHDRWDDGLWLVGSNNYEGYYIYQQALLGPFPGNDPDTAEPLWRNSRIGQSGTQTWKEDPTETGSWGGGPGAVHYHDGENLQGSADEPGPTDGPEAGNVHIHYESTEGSFGTPAFAEEHTHAFANRMHLTQMLIDFGPLMGVSLDPADDGIDGSPDVAFESDRGEIIQMQAQPDEAGDTGTYDLTTNWYIKAVPQQDGDNWGPSSPDGDGNYATVQEGWQGGLLGPEGFAAAQDQDITGFVGSSLGWATVSSSIWSQAMTEEAADPDHDGGLRAVALPAELLSPTPPAQVEPTAAPETIDSFRNLQTLAMRLTLRPPRHRWLLDPELPDVEVLVPTVVGDIDPVRRRFY